MRDRLFGSVPVPDAVGLGGFHLAWLRIEDVDVDFDAVVESADILPGLLGDGWPEGLTRRDNLADLGWHEVESRLCRSFAWVVRTEDGAYLGCAYLKPGVAGAIFAPYWFRAGFGDEAAIDRFDHAWRGFADGLAAAAGWPPGSVQHDRRSRFKSG